MQMHSLCTCVGGANFYLVFWTMRFENGPFCWKWATFCKPLQDLDPGPLFLAHFFGSSLQSRPYLNSGPLFPALVQSPPNRPTSPSVSGGEWGQRGEAGGCQERSHHAMSRCYYPPTTTYSVCQICVYMYTVYTEAYTIYLFTTERVATMPWVLSLCYPTHQTKPSVPYQYRTALKKSKLYHVLLYPYRLGFFHAMRPYYQCQEMALPHAIHRQLTHNSSIKQRSDGSWKDEKEKRPKDER